MTMLQFVFGENGLIVFLPCREQVKDDAGQFMGGGSDRFGGTHLGAHPTIIVAEESLAPV
jgi:hypothetical protein